MQTSGDFGGRDGRDDDWRLPGLYTGVHRSEKERPEEKRKKSDTGRF